MAEKRLLHVGKWWWRDPGRQHSLIVTTERVVRVRRGFLRSSERSVFLRDVASASLVRGLFTRTLIVRTRNGTRPIQVVGVRHGREAVDLINKLASATPAIKLETVPNHDDPLTELKLRYARGELTDEEYERRREVLTR